MFQVEDDFKAVRKRHNRSGGEKIGTSAATFVVLPGWIDEFVR
jgi:hypothetical protein